MGDAISLRFAVCRRSHSFVDGTGEPKLKREPSDVDSKNNLALLALLLDAQEMNPNQLAWEVTAFRLPMQLMHPPTPFRFTCRRRIVKR